MLDQYLLAISQQFVFILELYTVSSKKKLKKIKIQWIDLQNRIIDIINIHKRSRYFNNTIDTLSKR